MLNDEIKTIYAIAAPLVFPEGFSIGSGKGKSNALEIERNGQNAPVIRGSTFAGLLRSEVENDSRFEVYADRFFGAPLDSGFERMESSLIFSDTVFQNGSEENIHNLMNRHTGSISEENKGLFSIEKVIPSASAVLFIRLNSDNSNPELDSRLIKFLGECLNGGILVGGNTNRGSGRCFLKEDKLFVKKFDMEDPDSTAEYLDFMYSQKQNFSEFIEIPRCSNSDIFQIDLTLGIPDGQDILCSSGNDLYPVSTVKADGNEYWKIPGSTLRGIFKTWFSRLAARDGEKLSDNLEEFRVRRDRKVEEMHQKEDAITDLFGSLQKKGRIHFCDAYSCSPRQSSDAQRRMHVVIDRFTGGTNPGKLFKNTVLISDGNIQFKTKISIRCAQEKEVRWLAKTLQALNTGIIRLGTSKSSGRVEVREVICTADPDNFNINFDMKGV